MGRDRQMTIAEVEAGPTAEERWLLSGQKHRVAADP